MINKCEIKYVDWIRFMKWNILMGRRSEIRLIKDLVKFRSENHSRFDSLKKESKLLLKLVNPSEISFDYAQ